MRERGRQGKREVGREGAEGGREEVREGGWGGRDGWEGRVVRTKGGR